RVVLGVEARVVDQDDHGLAGDVDAGIVVPAQLRRVHAVAHEHQVAVGDLDLGLAGAGADHHVGAERELAGLAGDLHVQHGGFVGGGLDHRHGLEEAAVVAAGFQPDALVLRLDVFNGHLAAGRAGRTALELIGGQRLHHLGEVVLAQLGAERVRGGGRGRRIAGVGRGGGGGGGGGL